MHVTHIIPTLSFGGAERTVVDIINSAPRGFTFSVIVFFPDTPLQAQITRANVEVICVPKKGQLSLKLFGEIKKVLQQLEPDVVHTHLFGADLWGRVAAHSLGIPVVSTEHNIIDNDGRIKSYVKRCLKNYSDISVACSEKVKQYMKKYYGLSDAIEVVRPGVRLSEFTSLALPRFSSPLRCVIVGRLVEQKGHEVALRALAQVKGEWRLSIVGNGPLEARLHELVEKLGLSDRVKFFPATNAIAAVYAAHDVVLMPSKWEGLAIVALEALAAGRPLFVSNVGGMSEIIHDGENGFLLSPTVSAFAQKIQWAFKHKAKLLSVGAQARAFAQENCGVERMVSQYTDIYQRLRKKK